MTHTVALPPTGPRAEALIAFTPPAHPVLGLWREALNRRVPVGGVRGVGAAEVLQRIVRRGEREADPPHCRPLALWGRPWRGAHGAWLRRRWPETTVVVLTRPD